MKQSAWRNHGRILFTTVMVILTTISCGSDTDSDRDGLTDEQELAIGTDPLLLDTDQDGLTDGQEVNGFPLPAPEPREDDSAFNLSEGETWVVTDPLNPDTDGDGLKDGVEVTLYGLNPALSDSDGNGVLDAEEKTKMPSGLPR